MKTPRKIRSVSAEMIRKMFISSMTTSMLIELSQVGSGLPVDPNAVQNILSAGNQKNQLFKVYVSCAESGVPGAFFLSFRDFLWNIRCYGRGLCGKCLCTDNCFHCLQAA